MNNSSSTDPPGRCTYSWDHSSNDSVSVDLQPSVQYIKNFAIVMLCNPQQLAFLRIERQWFRRSSPLMWPLALPLEYSCRRYWTWGYKRELKSFLEKHQTSIPLSSKPKTLPQTSQWSASLPSSPWLLPLFLWPPPTLSARRNSTPAVSARMPTKLSAPPITLNAVPMPSIPAAVAPTPTKLSVLLTTPLARARNKHHLSQSIVSMIKCTDPTLGYCPDLARNNSFDSDQIILINQWRRGFLLSTDRKAWCTFLDLDSVLLILAWEWFRCLD